MTENRQVQQVDPKRTLVETLAKEKGRIQNLLPTGMTADQQLSAVMLLVNSKPEILKCSVPSIMQSIHTASSFGLILGSSRADAYLVPFKGVCTCVISYRGLLRLAYNSGKVKWADARLVFEGEEFECEAGLNPRLIHKPKLDGVPGKLRGAYFVAKMTNGEPFCFYLTKEQMDIYRKRSMAANSGFSPWTTDENAMYLKTVIRRGVNLLPWSPEDKMVAALEADDRDDEAPKTPQVEQPRGNSARLNAVLEVPKPPPVDKLAEKHADDGWNEPIDTLEEAHPEEQMPDFRTGALPGFDDERHNDPN